MNSSRFHRGMLLAAAAVLPLAGCGTAAISEPTAVSSTAVAGPGSSAPDSAGSATPTPAAAPAADPAAAEPSRGAALSVTDVRVAAHDDFDRVVYEFGGTGTPGWSIRYVDEAVQDGSGETIDVPGRSMLEVSLTGTGYPFDTGVQEYSGPNPQDGAGAVTQVRIATVFEGVTQSFIGLSTPPRPVKVSLLSDPVRVAVDVMH